MLNGTPWQNFITMTIFTVVVSAFYWTFLAWACRPHQFKLMYKLGALGIIIVTGFFAILFFIGEWWSLGYFIIIAVIGIFGCIYQVSKAR